MKYINTYEETKILNYILSVNENNQINEGLVDRIKEVAEKGLLKVNTIKDLLAKGVLTAGVITTLLSSSPAFAKEYNKLDSSDKNKTEKFVKVDKTDSSDTTTNFGGPSGPTPGILKIDFSSNFRSGEYKLSGSDLQQMNSKLQQIKDFVTNSKTKTFKLIIHSSESRVRSDYPEGELAKLRGEEALRVIVDYKTGGVFKPTFDPKVGDTPFDDAEANRIGMKKAVNLPKYTKEQYVNVEIIAMDFDTPCNWTALSPGGQTLTAATDYSITTDFDVTDQVGGGEIILSPGGIPDRVQVLIDGQVVGDSGYFVDNMTSQDTNRVNFNYIPRYVVELTKVSAEKGISAAKSSSVKNLITKKFNTFEELVDFMLTPEAKKNGYDAFKAGQDTGDYMKILKNMWGKPGFRGYRTFTFYDTDPYTTGTPVKVKFKLNGNNRVVQIKIFSPIGKTDYSCVSNCQ
jgi:mRNA-degrading endonuclease RelE of RelBE toxin-antitoxin system